MSANDTGDFLRLAGELAENCGRVLARNPLCWEIPFFLIRACRWVIVAGDRALEFVGCIKKRITGNLDLTVSIQE